VNLAVYVHRIVEEEQLMDVIDPVLKNVATTIELETMEKHNKRGLNCILIICKTFW